MWKAAFAHCLTPMWPEQYAQLKKIPVDDVTGPAVESKKDPIWRTLLSYLQERPSQRRNPDFDYEEGHPTYRAPNGYLDSFSLLDYVGHHMYRLNVSVYRAAWLFCGPGDGIQLVRMFRRPLCPEVLFIRMLQWAALSEEDKARLPTMAVSEYLKIVEAVKVEGPFDI